MRMRTLVTASSVLHLLFSVGCPGDVVQDDDTVGDPDLAVTVEASPAIVTVVTVRWSTTDPTSGYVQWGPGEDLDNERASTAGDATDHEVQLRGLVADTTYGYRVVAERDGDVYAEKTGTVTTSPLPPELQQFTISVDDSGGGDADGGYLFTPLVSGDEFPVILDRDGNVVWYHIDQVIPKTRILGVQPSCDGESVWFDSINAVGDQLDMAWIVRVSWDGTEVHHFEVLEHNHDFVELPDGSVGTLFHDVRTMGEDEVRGDRIVEVQPDGSIVEVWSVWDYFPYEVEVYPEGTGWTHANALEYLPHEDAYYVSLRNFGAIVRVERSTREVVWVLGGEYSDFAFQGNSPFADQHGFEILDGSMLVFDNGTVNRYESRAVGLDFDSGAWTIDETWAYLSDPPMFVPAGGDVKRLPSGNTLVTWSTAGQIDEVDPDDQCVWTLNLALGAGVFYVNWQEDLYEPQQVGCGT